MIGLLSMLSRIKNSQFIFSLEVECKLSKLNKNFLNFLLRLGFIRGFSQVGGSNKPQFRVFLKYSRGSPVVNSIKVISKPGHKVYISFYNVLKLREYKQKIYVLFTPHYGIITLEEALRRRVGGELFCVLR